MSKVVIQVENVSKQYRLGEVGTGSLKDDFKRFRYRLMGKEDPFLSIGEVNDRTKKGNSEYVWALKDINFSINQGDVVGIIGRNGAGKSTLLKLLSRTTGPTTGSIKMKGRIASLLEVGTGFHGELSGRENIFLNGAIMGLRKHEIAKKLDEIIDFAGVERYLDTPVKRYSSGMYVRLAFAVAAHLEPEILIVDEVLAVGDLDFQKKALGKMKEVSNSAGRTVLFVSHSMSSIKNLCSNAILLLNGSVAYNASANEVVDYYISNLVQFNTSTYVKFTNAHRLFASQHDQSLQFESIELLNAPNGNQYAVTDDIEFGLNVKANKTTNDFRIAIGIMSMDETPIGVHFSNPTLSISKGESKQFKIRIRNHQLAKGQYYFDFSIGIGNEINGFKDYDHISKAIFFEISYKDSKRVEMIGIWDNAWGKINFQNIQISEA